MPQLATGGDEVMDEKPKPALNRDESTREPEPAPKDERDEEECDSRLAMSHQEAEIIAQNLKESGTRR